MSKELRARSAYLREENKRFTSTLQPFAPEGSGPSMETMGLAALWRSNRFLVQVFHPVTGGQRISINRTAIDENTGRWVDGITWNEIQAIKSQIGFGAKVAIELYPPDADVVDVANMRHIWLLDEAPPFMWSGRRRFG